MTGTGGPLSNELSLTLASRSERPVQPAPRYDGLQQMHLSHTVTRAGGVSAAAEAKTLASVTDGCRTLAEAAEQSASGSVFASLMSGRGMGSQRPAAAAGSLTAMERPSTARTAVAADVPLSEIGFGPGMLLRLSQLGLRTTADLARSNAMQLRADLGDSSRLVDVEAWIRRATECALRA